MANRFLDEMPQFVRPLQGAPWSGPYVHSAPVPQAWTELEIGLISLSCLTLFHASRHGRLGIWFGYMAFALFQEILAFATECLRHGHFTVMLTNFLPLKEAMWYPLAFYPVHSAISNIRPTGFGAVGIFAVAAFLHQLHNIPYDRQGVTEGVEFFLLNKDYTMSDFKRGVDEWHGGVPGILFSHIGMGGATALAGWHAEGQGWQRGVGLVFMAGMAGHSLWGLYHIAKATGCTRLDPMWCIEGSEVTDYAVWKGAFLAITGIAFWATLVSSGERRPKRAPSHLLPALCATGYHALLHFVVVRHGKLEPCTTYCAVAAIVLHFLVVALY
eukprot:Hpha_TRINITY_DN27833_c0_g1::TRINITY_DN27833_c0_g1_i1::g.193991::m.193991